MSGNGGKMKLKLNTAQAVASGSPSVDPNPTPSTALKLSFRRPSQALAASPPSNTPVPATPTKATPPKKAAQAAQQPKSNKKRGRQAEDTREPPPLKRPKAATIRLSQSSGGPNRKGSIIARLKKQQSAQSPSTPTQTRLKIKSKGKPPHRPHGVGYDSEAEDAEEDPAIEENIILRMVPGDDCDYIRKAIEERRLGVNVSQGGADVSLRFFTRDARRAAVRVQDRYYAAVLVDLPCVVETMKSWDKRGWWKSADICQMLIVTQRIKSEEEAKTAPLPPQVDQNTWQWPHGLTPPMHHVRKRRFRKRVSHRVIEHAEEEVERLLAADEQARAQGGIIESKVMSWDELRREEEGDDYEEEEEDAEGDLEGDETGYFGDAVADEDEFDWQAQLEAGLAADDDEEENVAATPAAEGVPGDADVPAPTIEGESSSSAPPPDGRAESGPEQPSHTSADASSDSDEDDDDDDNDDDDREGEEVDEEAREKAQQIAQQRDEILHIERQITERREQLAKQTNPLLKQKLTAAIKRFEEERDVKKRGLGDDDEDD